jgi:predicted nuclease of predicted toxin-antitoxin system
VKLLFDQNLSPRLVQSLADVYPESAHVQSAGLATASDDAVWIHAKTGGFTILSKDEDFNDMAVVRGFPPKVLWLQLGNCTTGQVEAALRAHHAAIEEFERDPALGTFVLR